jgi:hypothetical protein
MRRRHASLDNASAHGVADAFSQRSPVVVLLDASLRQLQRGEVLTSRRAKAERRRTFRHFLLMRARLISAGIRQLLRGNTP